MALTGVRYRDEILRNIVRPYAGATGPDFILMDDNGPGLWSSIFRLRPLIAWTGQHVHQTSTQLNMLGTCYRLQFQLVLYNQPAHKSSELH